MQDNIINIEKLLNTEQLKSLNKYFDDFDEKAGLDKVAERLCSTDFAFEDGSAVFGLLCNIWQQYRSGNLELNSFVDDIFFSLWFTLEKFQGLGFDKKIKDLKAGEVLKLVEEVCEELVTKKFKSGKYLIAPMLCVLHGSIKTASDEEIKDLKASRVLNLVKKVCEETVMNKFDPKTPSIRFSINVAFRVLYNSINRASDKGLKGLKTSEVLNLVRGVLVKIKNSDLWLTQNLIYYMFLSLSCFIRRVSNEELKDLETSEVLNFVKEILTEAITKEFELDDQAIAAIFEALFAAMERKVTEKLDVSEILSLVKRVLAEVKNDDLLLVEDLNPRVFCIFSNLLIFIRKGYAKEVFGIVSDLLKDNAAIGPCSIYYIFAVLGGLMAGKYEYEFGHDKELKDLKVSEVLSLVKEVLAEAKNGNLRLDNNSIASIFKVLLVSIDIKGTEGSDVDEVLKFIKEILAEAKNDSLLLGNDSIISIYYSLSVLIEKGYAKEVTGIVLSLVKENNNNDLVSISRIFETWSYFLGSDSNCNKNMFDISSKYLKASTVLKFIKEILAETKNDSLLLGESTVPYMFLALGRAIHENIYKKRIEEIDVSEGLDLVKEVWVRAKNGDLRLDKDLICKMCGVLTLLTLLLFTMKISDEGQKVSEVLNLVREILAEVKNDNLRLDEELIGAVFSDLFVFIEKGYAKEVASEMVNLFKKYNGKNNDINLISISMIFDHFLEFVDFECRQDLGGITGSAVFSFIREVLVKAKYCDLQLNKDEKKIILGTLIEILRCREDIRQEIIICLDNIGVCAGYDQNTLKFKLKGKQDLNLSNDNDIDQIFKAITKLKQEEINTLIGEFSDFDSFFEKLNKGNEKNGIGDIVNENEYLKQVQINLYDGFVTFLWSLRRWICGQAKANPFSDLKSYTKVRKYFYQVKLSLNFDIGNKSANQNLMIIDRVNIANAKSNNNIEIKKIEKTEIR